MCGCFSVKLCFKMECNKYLWLNRNKSNIIKYRIKNSLGESHLSKSKLSVHTPDFI